VKELAASNLSSVLALESRLVSFFDNYWLIVINSFINELMDFEPFVTSAAPDFGQSDEGQ
jgi:hypothetical protein